MITVQEAVLKATNYFNSLFKDKYSNLMLEEVEFDTIEDNWLITLGYDIEDKTGEQDSNTLSGASSVFGPRKKYRREYKLFKVRGADGHVVAMKIRSI